jgi:hypothetical protein
MPHSPGPWQAEAPPAEAYLDPDIALSEEVRFWIVDEGRGSEVLAEVTLTMHGNEEANARLIAAAPDLLAACRAVLEQFDSGALVRNTESDGLSDWALRAVKPLKALADMKAAIAKAEGR